MAREFKTGVKITGDARGAVSATKATRTELDRLNTSVEKQTKLGQLASGSIGQYVARVAGVAAVSGAAIAAVGSFAKSIADQGDRVQKLSIQLGTSTEFISGMGYAADLSGGSLETFTTGLRKMEKSIGDASAGLSTQVRALDRLGLTYEDLKNLSPENQFLTIADRMAVMEDKSLRTATAMDIFGRSGAELIPLLVRGGEGIQEMRDEAERLGLVMSQEFADASAQFNDDLTRSQGVVTGIKRQIGEGLIPELDALAQQFVESAGSTDTWKDVGEFLGNLVRVLVAGFTTLKEVVVLTAEAIWSAGKIIVDTLAAIVAPLFEFSKTVAEAFAALTRGDFSAAAESFTGLGDRMAAAFIDNISLIKTRLQEFGEDSSGRIADAVQTVNDILTRQAVVSQDAASGMAELADQTDNGAKAAEQAKKQFEALLDRLDPLAKLGRQFTVEQAILAGKIAEGGEGVAYYTQLLDILKEQYAAAAREAVGFGDKAAAAAEKAAERAAAAAQKEATERAKALAQQEADRETFQKAFERGVERMDDLGADLWRGWFTGAKNALDSIKDFFLNWLGEMAHAAITRPILVSIMASLGIGGAGSAIAGTTGAGGVGGIGAGIAGAGGAGGLGGLGGIASLFTGSGIGQFFSNLPTWLGGTNAGLTTSGAPALFGNASLVPNWQFGIAGILGGILGDKIFGGAGGIGGSLGATIGTAILPGLGSVIGGVLGGAIGGLFGKDKPPKLAAAGFAGGVDVLNSQHNFQFESAFGDIFLRAKRIEDAAVTEFGQALVTFDETIASFLDADQVATISAALDRWSSLIVGDTLDTEQIVRSRFDVILGTFSAEIRDFVDDVAGIEEQVQRLGLASTAQRIIDAAPELFQGRTFREFIAVAEAMQESGEDLITTFQRLVDEVIGIVQQLDLVSGYAGSDLVADFNALMEQQGYTLLDVANNLGEQIRELRAGFTGSADDLQRLAQLVSQRYDAEIAYLQQIEQISSGITDGFKGIRETIEQDLLGPEAYYEKITGQAEALAATLKTLTDPAQIAATVAEIQRLTTQAYGLLDDAGKAANAQGFLDFIAGVETDAQDALTLARDLFVEESGVLRNLVQEMAADFADPLDIAAAAHQDAAARLEVAAQSIIGAAGALGSVGSSLVTAVRTGISEVVTAVGTSVVSPVVGTPAVIYAGGKTPAAASGATDVAAATAILKVGDAMVRAVRQSAQPSQVKMIFPGRGMVNS